MTEAEAAPSLRLLDTHTSDIRFQDALENLFQSDGTIYLVSGYFTYQGYLAIHDEIESFLVRSRSNELIVVVSPASDQFSPRIATKLWKLDDHDQVHIYKRPRGLHTKLYLREGPEPTCIIGSANITQIAFKYNTELSVELRRDRTDHPDLQPFFEWVNGLVEESEPLTRRDLYVPMQVEASMINWSNKARHLPLSMVIIRAVPVLILLVIMSAIFAAIVNLL